MDISAQYLPRAKLVFFTVAVGVFMSTMDSSMVNVALPMIMKSFHSSLALTEWVVLVYLLTITILLIFWGRLCSVVGYGRIYSFGMLVFSGGSFLCSIAPGIFTLILFRFIQGVGASMMMATGPALIKSIFPVDRLGRGLGLIGISTSMGLMAGPVIGGLLIRWLDWRAIFWVTVPVGLFFYSVGRRHLVNIKNDGQPDSPLALSTILNHSKNDLAGFFLWAGVVGSTVLTLTYASYVAAFKSSALYVGCLVIVLTGWLYFFRHESRQAVPFFPLKLFAKRFFAMAIFSSMLSFAVLFMVLVLTPFYLDRILGFSSDRIGYVMMAVPLSVFIVSPVAGHLHDRVGAKIVATAGLLCCFAGLCWLITLHSESTAFDVAIRLALLGFGQAMFLSPNSASTLAGVPQKKVGVTAGMLATARNFGMVLGAALAGLLFSRHFAAATGGLDLKDFHLALTGEFMSSFKQTFLYGLVISSVAVIFSWFRQKSLGFKEEKKGGYESNDH